jgi:hypothetical protein
MKEWWQSKAAKELKKKQAESGYRLPYHEKKYTTSILLKLTDEEKQLLALRATAAGIGMSEYLRTRI